jgi:transglutaminase-like putative cysteine protease
VKVRISYRTKYGYEEPVSFSPHLFRLFPKVDRQVDVLRQAFHTNAEAVVHFRRDLFDNEVASCFYPGPSRVLSAALELELEITPKNPFGFLLERHALMTPFCYEAVEAQVLAPYLRSDGDIELSFWRPPAKPEPTPDVLVALNVAIHEHLEYERRDEGEALLPVETLRRGRGACRDFAVLLAEKLRGLGIAARLASGYLCEFGDADKVAEGSLHAWVEAYLPGAGWVGLDPTNGTLCSHHHLTAAVGLTPAQISPVLGRYYHPKRIASEMQASLSIVPHD